MGVALLWTVFMWFSVIPCRDINPSLQTCWFMNTYILTKDYTCFYGSNNKNPKVKPFHHDLKKSIYSFLCKNLYCKNVEAEIKFNFKGQMNQNLDISSFEFNVLNRYKINIF